MAVIYLLYIIFEFRSSTYKFLNNIKSSESLYEEIGKLFKTPPVINMRINCYHYYSQKKRYRNVIYSEHLDLPYYSCKDVSGLFHLNLEKVDEKKKRFIKLNLIDEINFADAISYSDYKVQKEFLIEKNKNKTRYLAFSETRYIPDMKYLVLTKIGTNDPLFFGKGWFIFSIILTLGQFYGLYIKSLCISQTFKIRKIVSTRYNLLEEQYNQQYDQLMPLIKLPGQQFNYQKIDTGFCSTNFQPKLPSEEEIKQAEKYQKYIPIYTIAPNGCVEQKNENFSYETFHLYENQNSQ